MKVIKKNLTFGTAMNALLKGHKVTRSIWKGYWFIPSKLELYNHEAPSLNTSYLDKLGQPHNTGVTMNPMIVAKLKNHLGYTVAQPYQVDMLAHDWEIVK